MRVCDICKSECVRYTTSVTIDSEGNHKTIELCSRCYRELYRKEAEHAYLAYVETVESITGATLPSNKTSLIDTLKTRLRRCKNDFR